MLMSYWYAVMVCVMKYNFFVIMNVPGVPIKVVDVVNPLRENSSQSMVSNWPCIEVWSLQVADECQ